MLEFLDSGLYFVQDDGLNNRPDIRAIRIHLIVVLPTDANKRTLFYNFVTDMSLTFFHVEENKVFNPE